MPLFPRYHDLSVKLKTGEPPDLPVCGKQEPTADLSGSCDASGLDQIRVSRHLSRVFRVHVLDTIRRRCICLEVEDSYLALGHALEVDVAAEQHAMFGCSRDRVFELKLGSRSAEEAFRTQRVEEPRYIGLCIVEV